MRVNIKLKILYVPTSNTYLSSPVTIKLMSIMLIEPTAVSLHFPVAMLTAHSLSPESLKRSIEMGARAYLPKEKLGQVVPFLEDIMRYEYGPGWRRLLKQLEGFFNSRWGAYWKISEEKFWKEFDEKTAETKK